jgi:hypothetical protein
MGKGLKFSCDISKFVTVERLVELQEKKMWNGIGC